MNGASVTPTSGLLHSIADTANERTMYFSRDDLTFTPGFDLSWAVRKNWKYKVLDYSSAPVIFSIIRLGKRIWNWYLTIKSLRTQGSMIRCWYFKMLIIIVAADDLVLSTRPSASTIIIWYLADIFSMGPLEANLSEIVIKILQFSLTKSILNYICKISTVLGQSQIVGAYKWQ